MDLTYEERRAGLSALGAAARAFALAQTKGYVWIGEQGSFATCEDWNNPPAPKMPNPEQLRLA